MKCKTCKHWFDNGTDLCSCDRDALLREADFFCAAWEQKPVEKVYTVREKPTNADRIRGMSDYEMADWIADILNHCDNKTPEAECLESCPLYACCNLPFDNIENWLKSPVEADE